MTIGIYKISNKYTGECLYVGQSTNIEERWMNHKKEIKALKHRQKGLISLYQKHGIEILDFSILEETPKYNLNNKEVFYFNTLRPEFYGQIPTLKAKYEQSFATKKKISETMKEVAVDREKARMESFSIHLDVIRKYASDKFKSKEECSLNLKLSTITLDKILKYYTIEWIKSSRSGRRKNTQSRKCDFCTVSISPLSKYHRQRLSDGSDLCCSKECYYEQNSVTKNLPREADLEFLYWNKQYTLRHIARLYNTSDPVILQRMKYYNIPRREKNELRFKKT